MMNIKNDISKILMELGARKGDTLYLTIDMSKVPLPEIKVELNTKSYKDRQDRWCQYVYEQILSIIGHDGTLILHSFSYGYIHGKEFDVDKTDSEVGPFTNYVRLLPEATRSLHPVFSLTGIGKNAKKILLNCGKSGFGPLSPFYRLSKFDAIFVGLGTTIGESMTYIHHLEQMYGVSYRFNQCFSHTVTCKGHRIVGPWLVNLRYLGVKIEPDLKKAEVEIIKSGVANVIKGNSVHQSVRVSSVDGIINNMLSKNPAALINPSILTKIDNSAITHIKC